MQIQTQTQMYYRAKDRQAQVVSLFLEMVEDGMTRENLEHCIKRRPTLWKQFENWLDKLPSKEAA
jgi:hypothetical protein